MRKLSLLEEAFTEIVAQAVKQEVKQQINALLPQLRQMIEEIVKQQVDNQEHKNLRVIAERKEAFGGLPPKLLVFHELAVYGVRYTRRHLYNLEIVGKFPKRVSLGDHSVAWVRTEIEEWVNSRKIQPSVKSRRGWAGG